MPLGLGCAAGCVCVLDFSASWNAPTRAQRDGASLLSCGRLGGEEPLEQQGSVDSWSEAGFGIREIRHANKEKKGRRKEGSRGEKQRKHTKRRVSQPMRCVRCMHARACVYVRVCVRISLSVWMRANRTSIMYALSICMREYRGSMRCEAVR
jgi:hypothetical protein